MVETEQVPLYSKLSLDLIEYITTHGQVHQKNVVRTRNL